MIYQDIYNQIDQILQEVNNVKEIHKNPTSKFTKYPAVVFFPSGVSNVFSTTASDFREYRFKLFIVVGINQTTMANVFQNVMANTCDAVLKAFSENWSMHNIEGRRTWVNVDSVGWSVDTADKGLLAVAEYDLIVKLSVDI